MTSIVTSFCVAAQIDVGFNKIDQAASLELVAAIQGKSMMSIGMANCKLGVEGAKAVAGLASVTPSLTKIMVSGNGLGDEGATALCNALRESKVTKVQELSLCWNDIGPDGAKAVAAMASSVASLSQLDASCNNLDRGGYGVQLLRNAVREREGFVLIDDGNG